jgi:hypothetical protein
MRIVAAALLICCLGACSRDDVSARARTTLVGRWAIDGHDCESAWLVYRRDGSWTTGHNRGRWSLADNLLTTKLTHWGDLQGGPGEEARPHICHIERIEWRGPDRFGR